MRILIVNDDGFSSGGITALAEALCPKHKITVVAPDRGRSGMSHALTFKQPVTVTKIDGFLWDCYKTSGTPADSVLIGVELLKNNPPDLILSGINDDLNLGTELTYSGTVHSAIEASLRGFPAMAISARARSEQDFRNTAAYFVQNFDYYMSITAPEFPISINIHSSEGGNIGNKLTHMGERKYLDIYTIVENGEAHTYTLDGEPLHSEKNNDDSDVVAFLAGYATITPLTADRTDYARLNALKNIREPR